MKESGGAKTKHGFNATESIKLQVTGSILGTLKLCMDNLRDTN